MRVERVSRSDYSGGDYYTVHVEPDELTVDSGKRYPFGTCLGTISAKDGVIHDWIPVGYKPHGYGRAARALIRAERDKLVAAGDVTLPLRLPFIRELASLLSGLKRNIGDDYRADEDEDDGQPGMSVTIGWSEDGAWSYQTGDNSFTGGAYGYPHWAVVNLYRRANCQELARDIRRQLSECVY